MSDPLQRPVRAAGTDGIRLDWQQRADVDPLLAAALIDLRGRPDIEAANRRAVGNLLDAEPYLIDVRPAGEVIPDMTPDTVLHAGPPITWERMCGPLRGALIGGLIHEGLAADEAAALARLERNGVRLRPCHEHQTAGPMVGVVTHSMPVFVVENRTAGNRAYCTINEGAGRCLRYGAYGPDVLARLRWLAGSLAPALRAAIRRAGGVNLKSLSCEAVQMGDDGHGRNKAASSLFLGKLLPHLVATAGNSLAEVVEFLNANDFFYLNISVAASKVSLDAASSVPYSTLITAMARNGTELGIRVSGLGDKWFTGPAQPVQGLYLPGYHAEEANPDLGDSAIMETAGLGSFVMAASPAIMASLGVSQSEVVAYTEAMYRITMAENPSVALHALQMRGSPIGIDLRKVVETGILPVYNTGICHSEAGVGQIGNGIARPPWQPFTCALSAFVRESLHLLPPLPPRAAS